MRRLEQNDFFQFQRFQGIILRDNNIIFSSIKKLTRLLVNTKFKKYAYKIAGISTKRRNLVS